LTTTPETPQIRNVLATNPRTGQHWVCQPDFQQGDWVCAICKRTRLKPFDPECSNCHAKILWDMG
jgi:exoribonuclease II